MGNWEYIWSMAIALATCMMRECIYRLMATSAWFCYYRLCNPGPNSSSCRTAKPAVAMRSCAELVQRLGSSRSSSEKQQAVATLLALPMTPQTWVTAVGAFPALAQMLTQPAGSAAARQLAVQLLERITNYLPAGDSTVPTAPDGIITALVLLMQHSQEDVCALTTKTLSSIALNADNQRQIQEAGAIAPLVQLLRSSSLLVHASAAMTLAHLLGASPDFVTEIIAAGAIVPLVHLLHSSLQLVQFPAASSLKALCYDVRHQAAIAQAGAVPPLIRLLASDSEGVQAEALRALLYLARNDDIIDPIAAACAIPLLVRLLTSSAEKVQELAAATLANLSVMAATVPEMLAAGAVIPLLCLLNSSSAWATSSAARTLADLADDNIDGQARIVAAGGIVPLTLILKGTGPAQMYAATALGCLANNINNVASIINAGAAPLLVDMLSTASMLAQGQALLALSALARHASAHDAFFAAGAITPLLHQLSLSSEEVQHYAFQGLLHLSFSSTFPEQFVAAGAIPPLVQLLRSELPSVQDKAVVLLGFLAITLRPDVLASINNAGARTFLTLLQSSSNTENTRATAADILRALTGGYASLTEALSHAPSPSPTTTTTASELASAAASSPSEAAPQQLPSRPRKSCWSCDATGVPLKKCSVCAVAAYCGAACQKTDWKAHKGQCAGLKAGTSGSGSSAAVGEK